MIKLKQILLETADMLDVPPYDEFDQSLTYPFAYFKNSKNVYIGKKYSIHHISNFGTQFQWELDKNNIEVYDRPLNEDIIIDGRLFVEPKIIALWYYPTREIFFEMIKALEKKLKHSLSSWKVEVYKYTGSNIIEKGSFENKFYNDYATELFDAKLIKVNEYK